jgi:CBS domain-containing protein
MTAMQQQIVADVMTPEVTHWTPDTPLRDVARLMTDHHVHAIYVFDDSRDLGVHARRRRRSRRRYVDPRY